MRVRDVVWLLTAVGLQTGCGAEEGATTGPTPAGTAKSLQPKSLGDDNSMPGWQAHLLAADARSLDRLGQVPTEVDVKADDLPAGIEPPCLKNMGILPMEGEKYRRVASLDLATPQLVPTHVDALSEIDCVSIISINFKPERPLYIFATLKSLFAAFPQGIEVNILVGDENADYLASSRLAQEIGEMLAAHVHVWPASQADGAYLRKNLSLHERGSWNYARALRSYRGNKNYLLIEDDVEWSRNAGVALNKRLREDPRDLVSLYNRPGAAPTKKLAAHEPEDKADRRLQFVNVSDPQHFFFGTQGIIFSPTTARGIGNFLQLRLHEAPYDLHMNSFFALHGLREAYAFPGLVQHVGVNGTGYGTHVHISPCFAEEVYDEGQR